MVGCLESLERRQVDFFLVCEHQVFRHEEASLLKSLYQQNKVQVPSCHRDLDD